MKYLFFITYLFFSLSALAQARVPAPYQADYNKMMQNQFRQNNLNFMRGLNMMNFKSTSVNLKWEYSITLKDSTKLIVNSKLFLDEERKSFYLEYKNKNLSKSDSNYLQRIYPVQTISAERMDRVWNTVISGIPTDSCWLFAVLSGPINAYSVFSESASVMEGNITAIQLNNGSIEAFDPEKLKEIIKDNPKAMKSFNKKDYYNAIRKYNEKELGG
ncbi:MAG: hypothetical protein HYX40_03895 [Sphingobacteriales bacterium]|nr:hypothetical protein [Sphingobacteriales bacterium]